MTALSSVLGALASPRRAPARVVSIRPERWEVATYLAEALHGTAAADLIVRRHGYPPRDVSSAPLEAAEAIRARIARDVAPGARAALVRAPAREGVALREAEAVALLKESTNDGGSGNA